MSIKVICYENSNDAYVIHSYDSEGKPVLEKDQEFKIDALDHKDYTVASYKMDNNSGEFKIWLNKVINKAEQKDSKSMGEAPKITPEDIKKEENKKEILDNKIIFKEKINNLVVQIEDFIGMNLLSIIIFSIIELVISVTLFIYVSPLISILFGIICTILCVCHIVWHHIKKSKIFKFVNNIKEFSCNLM